MDFEFLILFYSPRVLLKNKIDWHSSFSSKIKKWIGISSVELEKNLIMVYCLDNQIY